MKAVAINSCFDIKEGCRIFEIGDIISFEREFVHDWTKRYHFVVLLPNEQKKIFSKESFEFYFKEEKIFIEQKQLFCQALGFLLKKREIAFAKEIIKKYPEEFDFSARG